MDFFPHRIGALEWLVVGGSGILGRILLSGQETMAPSISLIIAIQ